METTSLSRGDALAAPPGPPRHAHPTGRIVAATRPDASPGGAASVSVRPPEGPDCLSSLDRYETTDTARPRWTPRDLIDSSLVTRPQRKIHARWFNQWRRLVSAFADTNDETLQKRAVRIDGCCRFPQVRRSASGGAVLAMNGCRDRCCPRCAGIRGFAAKDKIRDLMRSMNAPRFVTLTLKHDNQGLKFMHDRLMKSFRRLRNSAFWKSHVRHGVYVVETTHTPGRNEWHVHLHLVVDGEFMAQKVLAKEWKSVTGDSMIVDIRAVHDREQTASYLCDYLSKPPTMNAWPAATLREFATAMHGRRIIGTFGVKSNPELDVTPKEAESHETHYVGSTTSIADRAAHGDETAKRAMEILQRAGRRWANSVGLDPITSPTSMIPIEPWEWQVVFDAADPPLVLNHGLPPDTTDSRLFRVSKSP